MTIGQNDNTNDHLPPYSITGVTPQQNKPKRLFVSRSIDYLQFTMMDNRFVQYGDFLPKHKALEIVGDAIPQKNYDGAVMLRCGAVISRSSSRKAHQGMNIMFQGSALSRMRAAGLSTDELIASIETDYIKKISRLDLCFDVLGAGKVEHVNSAVMRGKSTAKARTVDGHTRNGVLSGIYVGSYKSDRYLNVYDKVIEQKLDTNIPWVRVELRNRNRYAAGLFDAVRTHGTNKVVSSAIEAFCDIPHLRWYQAGLSATAVALDAVQRKQTSFETYVKQFQAAALKKIALGENIGDIKALITALETSLALYKYDVE